MKKMTLLLAAAVAALLALPSAYAEKLSCPKIYGNNMCLQRRAPIRISGKADPGKTVTVTIEGSQAKPATAKAGDDGEWEAKLDALEAGGPYKVKVTDGADTITFDNVLIGEVWICAGQSNMELPVSTGNTMIQIKNHQQEAAAANYPRIRLFEVPKTKAPGTEFDDIVGAGRNTGIWMECSPQTVPNFSAAGYFFARQLQKDLDIPVGLIMIAWGGVNIETFIPDSEFAKHNRREAAQIEDALLAGAANPENGQVRGGQFSSEKFPGTMWGAMAAPWTRVNVGGVLFYQGESNTGNKDYYALHKMLIEGWREKWNDPKQPWVICQLAGFEQWTPMNRLPEDQWKSKPPMGSRVDGWALTREIQDEMSYIYENVSSVPLMDIGDQSDIHPRDKQTLGYRLAKLVEWKYFGGELGVGPVYDHMDIKGDKCIIHFKNVGKGLTTSDGEAPGAFAIAGADGNFVWADAKIVGDTVEVSSDKVKEPKTVRFAYIMYRGDVNLMNKDGFPAYPFRTDKVKNEYEPK
ncbi:MAG: hypothetical protein IKP09_00400 [Lentisphaeria bacterium]|nr:hypothetical protein [Lentisphaeria bacterium]